MQWSDIPRNPSTKQLRTFAAMLALFLIVLQAWYARTLWEQPILWLLCEIATWFAIAGVFWPRLMRRLFVGWLILVFPLGWTVSHVLLAVLFYGVFTPLGLVFRLFRRDPLALRRAREVSSYWQAKPSPEGLASYFRQF
jgi:hypothetical protein